MMTTARDHLSKVDTIVIAAIEAGAPMLVKARDLIDRFQGMIRKKTEADLEPWIDDAEIGLLASFRQRHSWPSEPASFSPRTGAVHAERQTFSVV